MSKLFVISLGGSLFVPGDINTEFLKNFRSFILSETKKGKRFILVTGGGHTCRKYQDALKKVRPITNNDLDWLGIYSTRFNAQLLRLIFKEAAGPRVADDPTVRHNFKEKILLAGGWKPGRSSDGAMVKFAHTYGAQTVINLSNIDYVYTKDPRKFKDAEKIETISWKDFRKIVGDKWDPGANLPFDPTAAKFAQKNNLTVIIANGKNLDNLKNILEGKEFVGTKIS